MNKVNRLWSVKGFNYEEITDPEYTKKYSTSELPKAWQLTPIISRILVEVKPVKIIYWRGAKQISVPV